MALKKYFFILAILFATLQGNAQEQSAIATAPTVKKAAAAAVRRPNTKGLRVGFLLWQENIKLKNGTNSADMIGQSYGLQGSYFWNRPFAGPRWSWVYSLDVGGGTIKGKGTTTEIPDTFANQAWVTVGGSIGLTYRTSAVSSLHFSVPVAYRMISWHMRTGSVTDPGSDSTVSAGVAGLLGTQMTPRSQLLIGFTHQHMWQATQWSLTWQTMFR